MAANRPRTSHRIVSFALAAAMVTACGGSKEEASVGTPGISTADGADESDPRPSTRPPRPQQPPKPPAQPPAPPTASTEPAPISTDAAAADSTVPPAEDLPTLAFSTLSAGPLTVTASQCEVDGIPDGVPDAGVESFALTSTHAFIPVSEGVAALAFTAGAQCSMTLDAAVGDGGLLATDDEVSSVAASANGRVAAAGVFGAFVFDVALGQSYACDDANGDVDLSTDGTTLMTSWFGSPVEQFTLTDSSCGTPTEVAMPAELAERYYVAFDGADLFVGGEGTDEVTYGGRVSGGEFQWKVGNPDVGGEGWLGWVHGMVPCNGGYCLLDTNTDQLIVTDAAGVIRASFEVSELIGERLFYHTLEVGPDGAVYLLGNTSADDGAGGRNDGNYFVRLEITG